MKTLNSLDEVKEKIEKEKAIILYFSSKNCGVCQILKPKLEDSLSNEFKSLKFYEIKCDENLDIASHFQVFQAPIIQVYLDGKKFLQEGRNISVNKFIEDIRRPYEIFLGED